MMKTPFTGLPESQKQPNRIRFTELESKTLETSYRVQHKTAGTLPFRKMKLIFLACVLATASAACEEPSSEKPVQKLLTQIKEDDLITKNTVVIDDAEYAPHYEHLAWLTHAGEKSLPDTEKKQRISHGAKTEFETTYPLHHQLTQRSVPKLKNGITLNCDECDKRDLPEGTILYSCQECDYDLCETCWSLPEDENTAREKLKQNCVREWETVDFCSFLYGFGLPEREECLERVPRVAGPYARFIDYAADNQICFAQIETVLEYDDSHDYPESAEFSYFIELLQKMLGEEPRCPEKSTEAYRYWETLYDGLAKYDTTPEGSLTEEEEPDVEAESG